MLSAKYSKLPSKSVINVSQIITIDKSFLTEKVHTLSNAIMAEVDEGLRLVLNQLAGFCTATRCLPVLP